MLKTVLKEDALIKKYSPILESIDATLVSESKDAMSDYKKYTLRKVNKRERRKRNSS